MSINESTKRALRTGYQGLLALGPILVTLFALLPADSPLGVQIAVVLAWHAAATKVVNELEDRGIIPAWLK